MIPLHVKLFDQFLHYRYSIMIFKAPSEDMPLEANIGFHSGRQISIEALDMFSLFAVLRLLKLPITTANFIAVSI